MDEGFFLPTWNNIVPYSLIYNGSIRMAQHSKQQKEK